MDLTSALDLGRDALLLVLVAVSSLASADAGLTHETYQVEMSDGVLLQTKVRLRPGSQAPWPVLLYRTPY